MQDSLVNTTKLNKMYKFVDSLYKQFVIGLFVNGLWSTTRSIIISTGYFSETEHFS